jgi:hypothetical protein
MTKKDYELLATAMQDTYPPEGPWAMQSERGYAIQQWSITCEGIADHLARDNGRFDRKRFLRACIPGNNVRARG